MAVEHPGTPPQAHTAAHGHSLGSRSTLHKPAGVSQQRWCNPTSLRLGAELRSTTSSSSLPLLQQHGEHSSLCSRQCLSCVSHLCPQAGVTDGTSTDLGEPSTPECAASEHHKHVCTCLYLEPGQGPHRLETPPSCNGVVQEQSKVPGSRLLSPLSLLPSPASDSCWSEPCQGRETGSC